MGLQEVDTLSVVRSLTKYAATITDPATIRHHIDLGLYHAREGRPGPVWIDIPLDVQSTRIDPDELVPADLPAGPPRNRPQLEQAVEAVIDRLQTADRPFLLLGGGIRIAGAADLATELVDRLGAPYGTTWVGADLVYDDHPDFAGRPGAFAPRGAESGRPELRYAAFHRRRWDFATTGFSHAGFARAAHRVVVDADAAELDKLRDIVDGCIEMDAGDFLRKLLRQLPKDWDRRRTTPWLERVATGAIATP